MQWNFVVKSCFLLILLALSVTDTQGQVSRYFLDREGKFVDSTNASLYALIRRNLIDSTWNMQIYSMNHYLLSDGYYKDEFTRIPHGKFKIYSYLKSTGMKVKRYNITKGVTETTIDADAYFLESEGAFIDGQKEGKWIHYFLAGGMRSIETYEKGKLNGPYNLYNESTQKLFFEGNYLDGLEEGKWNKLGASGQILESYIYRRGKRLKTINYNTKSNKNDKVVDGKPSYNFRSYLLKKVPKSDLKGLEGRLVLVLTLTKDGKFVPKDVTNTSTLTDKGIRHFIDIFTSAPAWIPAHNKDGTTLDSEVPVFITFPQMTVNMGFNDDLKELYEKSVRPVGVERGNDLRR